MKYHIPILFIALGLSACDQPGASAPPPDITAQVGTVHFAYADPPASREEHRARAIGSHEDMVEVNRILSESGDWQTADRRLRAFIDEPGVDAVRASRRAQKAAVSMIRTHLSTSDLDSERAEALGHYTRLLVNAESPEAALIRDALDQLEPYWEPAELRQTAIQTADHTEAYVSRSQTRMAPEHLNEALSANGQPPLEAFEAQAVEAARSLRESADG